MADINWGLTIVNENWQAVNSDKIKTHSWIKQEWEYKNEKFICTKCKTTMIKRELMGGYATPSHYYRYSHFLLKCEDIVMEKVCG